jgi:ribosomal-protein-alanine N-acetyltransferase
MDDFAELLDFTLEGERVLLRPAREADAAQAFPLLHGRREVLDWLVWQGPESVEELASKYRSWNVHDEHGQTILATIVERSSLRMRGSLSVRAGPERAHELGYWIDPAVWGHGLGSEAVGLACWLAFEHLGAELVGASVFDGNQGSARVLEKNGLVRSPGAPRCRGAESRPQHGYLIERAAWLRLPGRVRPLEAHLERLPRSNSGGGGY